MPLMEPRGTPPAVSLAHDVDKGPNGGPVVEAAGHHVEFVNEGAVLSFFPER
jgi:hypothetical protein